MRAWRPAQKCLYVIPEIHGNSVLLEHILNRVLPLRIFKGQEDFLIFMGDYIDKHTSSDKVIDLLINIKKEYQNRIIFLKGNHEQMLLDALSSEEKFKYWIQQGGHTTIDSYLQRMNSRSYWTDIKFNRIKDIIPAEHLDFIKNLDYCASYDEYIFFHGSFDNNKKFLENNPNNFIFDTTASRYVKECISKKIKPELDGNKIYVGAHNYKSSEPFLTDRYYMLGGGAPNRLFIFELNSMLCCSIRDGKKKMYPFKYTFL